ncbi:MAG TPA: DUF167 domain-containing protein [Gaiellaceae bacterium]|nr:DUF167 domain-containing protein [Gaiellaceae bacterium]
MVAASTTRLRLRVIPGAPSDGIVGRHGEAWKVRVAAPPEDGRANDAVVRLLARTLGVARGDVTLVAGHGSRDKVVELTGLEPDEVDRRLEEASA